MIGGMYVRGEKKTPKKIEKKRSKFDLRNFSRLIWQRLAQNESIKWK